MSPTQQRGMHPFVKTRNIPKEPTHGQLDDRLSNLLAKDQRTDNWMLHVGHNGSSGVSEMGQGELMDLSVILGFLLSLSRLANYISCHYQDFTQPTHL